MFVNSKNGKINMIEGKPVYNMKAYLQDYGSNYLFIKIDLLNNLILNYLIK